jgi:hypothetical protein
MLYGQNKKCKVCKKIYFRIPGFSDKQWGARKLCSQQCWYKYSAIIPKRKGWHWEDKMKKQISDNQPNKNKFTSTKYHTIHTWLLRQNGAKECIFCGSPRFVEWALKRGYKHKHDINHYLRLCSSCHKIYDYTDERRKNLSNALKGRKIYWADKIGKANRKKHAIRSK